MLAKQEHKSHAFVSQTVQRTDRDAHAIGANVSEPQDPFTISDDGNAHIILWPGGHELRHPALHQSAVPLVIMLLATFWSSVEGCKPLMHTQSAPYLILQADVQAWRAAQQGRPLLAGLRTLLHTSGHVQAVRQSSFSTQAGPCAYENHLNQTCATVGVYSSGSTACVCCRASVRNTLLSVSLSSISACRKPAPCHALPSPCWLHYHVCGIPHEVPRQ